MGPLNRIKASLIFLPLLFLGACGVKGFPQPPLQPAPIGHGEPSYSKTSQKTPIVNHYDPSKENDDESTEGQDEK